MFNSLTSIMLELRRAPTESKVSVSMSQTKRRRSRSSPEKFKILKRSEARAIASAQVCDEKATANVIKCPIKSPSSKIAMAASPDCKIKWKSSKGFCRTPNRPPLSPPRVSGTSPSNKSIQSVCQGSSRVPRTSSSRRTLHRWSSLPISTS